MPEAPDNVVVMATFEAKCIAPFAAKVEPQLNYICVICMVCVYVSPQCPNTTNAQKNMEYEENKYAKKKNKKKNNT